uniref:L-type lectin-domain containing receptor kinase VIII.2-like n=1 Tax=Erigeron canadensis TaxID=72917 RepID=UPI001CB9827F|nr:L-type lectin-domain containing receptor kinase VIII.2-like [Erigeron canadensis]
MYALVYIYSLFLLCFSAVTFATTFDIQTLNTTFKFLGDAHILNSTFRLTSDLPVPNSGAGRVLYNKPITFRRPGNQIPTSFATHFSFSVLDLNLNSIGGGFAFVISPDDRSIGAAGGFLGIPAGSVAVEFDTVKDIEFNDVNGNHVGLSINSMVSLHAADLDSVNVSLKSGELIHSWVEYSGSNHHLKVFVSYAKTKPVSPVLLVTIDLYQYVNESMYVGFSGSTQGSTEVHWVDFWSFTSFFDDPNRKSVDLNTTLSPSPPIATIKYPKLNKLMKGLIGLLVGIIVLTGGGISIYLKYQYGGGENKYFNICNCCSNVNNVAV